MMRGAGPGAVRGGGVGGGPAGATLVVASLQLVWNHPFLTGFVMLMFTPPFFPLVVYFSPLVMSTALCIAALVSLGSQMEKIKAEGGEQLEIRLGFENGVGAWVESTRPDRREALNYRFGSSSNNINNNSSSSINIIDSINPQATEVGHWARDDDGMVSEEAESDSSEGVPEEIISEEEEEDQWDAWVKEYEEEWEDIEDTEPIAAVTSIARHPPSPTPTPTPPQPRQKEIVAEEQQPVLRPLVPLAPIRTGREHGSVKMADRHVNPVDDNTKKATPSKDGGSGTSKAHVSDVEALQSIEKLLHMEVLSRPKMMEAAEIPSPNDDGGRSKHRDNNIVPADVIRHLKTGGLGSKGKDASASVRVSPVKESSSSTTPKLQQNAGANVHNYAEMGSSSSLPQPDDVHTARSENIEKVVRPPLFSPQFLQSLQPLPPKDPPRLLHNLKPGRLGNPVEKLPEWVHARPHQERMLIGHKVSATDQTKKMPICEEKPHHRHVMDDVTTASEVKVVSSSHSRRRAHANRAIGVEGTTDLQQRRRQQQQQQQQEEETISSSSALKAASPAAKVVTHGHHPEDKLAPQTIIIHEGISPAPMTSRRRRHSSHHHHHHPHQAAGAIGNGTPQRRVEEKIDSVPKNNIPSSLQVEDDDDDDVHAEKEMAGGGSQNLQVKPVLDQWGRGFSAQRSTPRKSRRKFEPRTVVSQDINNSFSLKKSSSLRNGKAIQYVDSSSDERESVTPRARRTERMTKPLVWRSRSSQTQEDTD